MKIEAWKGPKPNKNRCLEASWSVLGRLGWLLRDFWSIFSRHWGEDRRNMGQVGAKLAASCAQDGPRWHQDGHLGLNFGGFGAILGVIWMILRGLGEDLGGVLAHGWESKNLDFP